MRDEVKKCSTYLTFAVMFVETSEFPACNASICIERFSYAVLFISKMLGDTFTISECWTINCSFALS